MNIKIKLAIGCFFILTSIISLAQPLNSHPLHNELVASYNYKKFFEKVKNQPESGGLFYATLVVKRCMKVQSISVGSLDGESGNFLRRKEAIGRLQSLCSGFKKSDLTEERIVDLLRLPYSQKDPILVPMQRLIADMNNQTNNVSLEDHQLIIKNLFAENSPEILTEISPFVPYVEKGYYFDGKYYPLTPAHDGLIFKSAILLAACDLGDRCDSSDFRLLVACAEKSICVDSRFEYLQAVFKTFSGDNSLDEMGSVVNLSNKVGQAIKNNDMNLFIPSP